MWFIYSVLILVCLIICYIVARSSMNVACKRSFMVLCVLLAFVLKVLVV